MQESAKALVIMQSSERRSVLLASLRSLECDFLIAEDCWQARRQLEICPSTDVIITDLSHPDGNWCDILTHVVDRELQARVVVVAPKADEKLWSEVLWRGVRDMLVEPYARHEAQIVIDSALRAADSEPRSAAA